MRILRAMKRFRCLAVLVCVVVTSAADAFKEARRPYVQSGPDGVFYARCLPRDATGSAGSTSIYKVHAEKDELVDRYDWFTQRGVVLGWSPIAGKVAVMALLEDSPTTPDKQVELSFYLGGAHLKSWTTAELEKLGAEVSFSHRGGQRAVFQVLGCEQIPRTNQYVFTIQLARDKKVAFDILTGDLPRK
jgi:hypothetical protein